MGSLRFLPVFYTTHPQYLNFEIIPYDIITGIACWMKLDGWM